MTYHLKTINTYLNMRNKASHIIFLFLFSIQVVLSKEVPPKPEPPRLVNDFAGVLSRDENYTLEQKLVKFNDSSSTQIAIVIENSLEGDDAFDYSIRLAERWGIGQKGKNNGILIYVAVQDRKIRIQVGYGLEGVVTDAQSKRIIEELIKPQFRAGSYYAGLNDAVDRIISLSRGEYKADAPPATGKKKGLSVFWVIVIILIILYLISRGNRNNRNYGSRGMDWWTAAMIGSSLGRGRSSGGWGDFSSGGGSFGGFGGGSFGGGGSGGDW